MNSDPASPQARAPFRLCTSFILQEATGLRAATLPQLAGLLRTVPESCLHYHTHYFLLAHHYLTPEPTNDFAYWVSEVLNEAPLGERLAGLDVMSYATLENLREDLARMIEQYLAATPLAKLRFAAEGEEFFFVKSRQVVMPTPYEVATVEGLAAALEAVSIRSLYFHMFDARLRLGRATNDFAIWLEDSLGLAALAAEVAQLDPYAWTLEAIRSRLIGMLRAAEE